MIEFGRCRHVAPRPFERSLERSPERLAALGDGSAGRS